MFEFNMQCKNCGKPIFITSSHPQLVKCPCCETEHVFDIEICPFPKEHSIIFWKSSTDASVYKCDAGRKDYFNGRVFFQQPIIGGRNA